MAAQDEGGITVVALGTGPAEHLTAGAARALAAARTVVLRTRRHPSSSLVADRPAGDCVVVDCDDIYEAAPDFAETYARIVDRVVEAAADGPVVYAVPGDTAFGEATVPALERVAAQRGIPLVRVAGVSFVGPTLGLLGWDGLDGLQIADATALAGRHHAGVDPDVPALVAQLHSRVLASDVKVVLLDTYPAEHTTFVVSAAGTPRARCEAVPLGEIDHRERFDDETTLAVPPLDRPGSLLSLAEVVGHLRAPDGCPWDREQTHESLREFLLEETYEALAALDAGDGEALAGELGDLLLQVVLHAQIAAESGEFRLSEVIGRVTDKIVHRHPHVFGDGEARTAEEVRVAWERLKRAERATSGRDEHPLADLPPALPALARAQAAMRKLADAAAGGADVATAIAAGDAPWPELAGPPADRTLRTAAIGAALWRLVAVAAAWGVDAEGALRERTTRETR